MSYHYKGQCSGCQAFIEIVSVDSSTTCTNCHGQEKKYRELFEATAWWTEADVTADEYLTKYQHWNGKKRLMSWSFWI